MNRTRIPSPRWLLGFAFGALLLTCVGTVGGYISHLHRQRQYQRQQLDCDGDPHWLSVYLPESWQDFLPETGLRVDLYGSLYLDEAGREKLTAALGLTDVQEIDAYLCDAPEELWSAVTVQKSLEVLTTDSGVSDEQIAELAEHRHLKSVKIIDAPLTDASLVTFASLPMLETLELRGTHVTQRSITSFSEAHPGMSIDWTPAVTLVQWTLVEQLIARRIGASPARTPGIQPVISWNVSVAQGITLDDVGLIAALGAINRLAMPVDDFGELPRPLGADVVEGLRDLPKLREVDWRGKATIAELRLFAEKKSIKRMAFDSRCTPAEDYSSIKGLGVNRIVDRAEENDLARRLAQ